MSRFIKELRVIPIAAWIAGGFIYACFTVPVFFFVAPTDPDMGTWPRWGQALVIYGVFLCIPALVALIGYIYGDAKRRQMRYVMWTLLAIFIPSAVGIIIYFILRDPLPEPCPGCRNIVKAGFPFCPNCGTGLHPTCPNCGKPGDPAWANCPYCGQQLNVPVRQTAQHHDQSR